MFESISGKLQNVFRDLRGLGKISESNVAESLREVRMALLSMQTDDEQEDALAAFARAEGRSDAMRNRAAIVLALQEHYEEAIELAVVSGEGQVRFRQEVRIAEWALHAEDAEAAQEHAWQARAAATLNRDRWYALTVLVEAHRMDDSLDRLIDRFTAAESLDEPSRQVWIDLLRETERFDEARALFAAGADDEVRVGQIAGVETGGDGGLVDGIEVDVAGGVVGGDAADGAEDLFAGAVGEADGEDEARVLGRARLGIIDGVENRLGQQVAPADNLNAHTVAMDARVLSDIAQPLDIEVEQGFQFGGIPTRDVLG